MAGGQTPLMFQYLRRLVRQQAGGEASDHELLDRFVQNHDEAAFEVLVWRHGPMVMALCRRMLRHTQDAEDALQATFLTLVRKAGSIHKRQALGSWLHKVAFRIALRARTHTAQRSPTGERVEDLAAAPPAEDTQWGELRPILDDAIQRLPRKYRDPVVLCYLQGQTNQEAARLLGCPLGTVCTRLNRARERLRRLLTRRNVTLSAAAMAGLLAGTATAALPLSSATVCVRMALAFPASGAISARVAHLSEGVIQAMTWSKIQLGTALFVTLCLIAAGAGSLAQLSLADSGQVTPPQAAKEPPALDRDKPGVALPKGALLRLGTPRSYGVATGAVPPVFTPDGRTVLSVSGNGIVLFWDAADGKAIRQFQGPATQVHALAVSPDGKLLAVTGTKAIHLLQLPDCKEVGNIDVPKGPTLTVAFSATGDRIASGGRDGAVRLWDVATRKEHKRFPDHKGPVRGLGLSPDGRVLYCSSEDGMLRVTETESGKVLFQRETQPFAVNRLAVSPSGEYFVTAGKQTERNQGQGMTQVWVTKNARIASIMNVPDELTSVAYSPDGKMIAAAGLKSMHLLDGPTGRILMQFQVGAGLPGGGVAISPDGKTVAATGAGAAVRFWDAATGKRRGEGLGNPGGDSSLAFSPDGKWLATGSVGDWGERDVRLWELDKGNPVQTLKGHEGNVHQIVFTPDGSKVVTGGEDGFLRVWDAASGKELDQVKFRARLLGMSAEGKTLTAVGADLPGPRGTMTFLVRDLAGKKNLVHRQERNTGNVVSLSPDEKMVVESQQTALRLLEVATGRPRALLAVPGPAGENTLMPEAAFSADGRFLAGVSLGRPAPGMAASGVPSAVQLWEVCSGQEVATVKTGTARLNSLALSADGRLVAGATIDGIHVWDTVSGNEVHHFPTAASNSSALLFAPREDRLASAHLDGTTLLWDLTSARARTLKAAAKPDAKALPSLWDDLAASAAKGQKAAWALVAGGETSVDFLQERLQPYPEEKLRQVAKYLADLNSDRFAVREKASKELEQLGDLAETPLRKSLASGPPLEVRRRIEALLARLTVVRSPETLRSLRAIQALERIGSPGARQVLERVSQGASLARESVEARAALERLRATTR